MTEGGAWHFGSWQAKAIPQCVCQRCLRYGMPKQKLVVKPLLKGEKSQVLTCLFDAHDVSDSNFER
jgi:hypothetical protein